MVATAIIGSALIGGVSTAVSTNAAAGAQRDAAATATAQQREMFNVAKDKLNPFIEAGQVGTNKLMQNLDQIAAPIVMDQAELEKTPGYQFNLAQGLKANANSAASRGLGISGAAIKGGEAFASGLASGTYQQQFENALANKKNMLATYQAPVDTGLQAAGALTGAAVNTGKEIGANTIGAGDATAAADIATGKAVSGVGNSLVSSLYASQLFGDTANLGKGIYSPTYSSFR